MVKLDEATNEKYFPRGGGSDKPKKSTKNYSDFPVSKTSLKRKSNQADSNDVKKTKEENSWIPKAESNTFVEGLTGLGVVAEVFDDSVVLHTAGTQSVRLHASEVSKKFTEMFNSEKITMRDAFQIGQMVPFKILNKQKDGKVKASCDPAKLNKHLSPNMLVAGLVIHTAVVSMEEKGAILDVGLDQITGFIDKAQLPPSGVSAGLPLIVRILSTTSRVIKVTSFVEQDNLNMASCEKLQLNHLMPGTILACSPTGDAITGGVLVSIGNGLKGILPRRNLPPRLRESPEKLGKEIRAVVMLCQQNSKILVLNAHPDMVAISRIEKRVSFEGIRIGDIVKCNVVDVLPNKSMVYFTLPPVDGKKSLVTAVSSRGLLEKPDNVVAEYPIGQLKKCRVTGFRYADRAITVSTRKDILQQKITSYQDAKCGDILEACVHHVSKVGVHFTVCNFVQAFAPSNMLSDQPLSFQAMKVKFKIGSKVKCRVWQICDKRKNLIVSCREQILSVKSSCVNNVQELEIGNTVPCIIRKIFPTGVLLLATFNNICGVLRIEEASRLTKPPKLHDVVVANVEKIDENNRVVFVLKEGKPRSVISEEKNAEKKTSEKLKAVELKNFGIYEGVVVGETKVTETQKKNSLFAEIRLPGDVMGRLHISEFPSNLLSAENPLKLFVERNASKKVIVRVIGFIKTTKNSRIAELTMLPSKIQAAKVRASSLSFKSNFSVGDVVNCFGTSTLTDNGESRVEVNPLWTGQISRENLSDDLKVTAADGGIVDLKLERGAIRQAKVVGVDRKNFTLSLTLNFTQKETEFGVGTETTGRVFFVSKTLIRLKLSTGQQAVLTPTSITDKYELVEEVVEKQLQVGKLVDVVCARVQEIPKRYFVALKSRYTSNCENEKRKLLLDVKEGEKYDGIVENASKGNLFVELGPGISGRIPVNEENQDLLELGTNSVVGVTVAKVTKKGIILSLDDIIIRKWTVRADRKRLLSRSDEVPSKVALIEEEATKDTIEVKDPGFDWSNKGFRNEDLAAIGKLTVGNDEESAEDDDAEDEEEEDEVSDEEEQEDDVADEEEEGSDVEEEEESEGEDEEDEEEEEEENKLQLIEKTEEEQSRIVRSNPNSAINWIEYMSLFIEKSDLAAARKTAEEAIESINPTESDELLKMWTAYLNMEVAYGDSTTVQKVFERACRNANSYTVHKTLAKIYQKFEKNSEATHIMEQMIKKFRANQLEVWTLLAEHFMVQKDQKAARDLLPRALKSAPKAQQHIQLISKFAQLEFKHGDAERGRTLLEGLVTAHPKKTDLWLVYADATLKHLGIEHSRKVLERACNLGLSIHKMRPLYKKWLEMESKHGDAASVELVKAKAEKFLQAVADNVLDDDN